MTFTTSIANGAIGTLVLWSVMAQAPAVVEFNAPLPSAPAVDIDALVDAYAAEHGLTCDIDPADAFTAGADIVLTIEVDEMMRPTTSTITAVSLDEALESGKHSRHNITACNEKENT